MSLFYRGKTSSVNCYKVAFLACSQSKLYVASSPCYSNSLFLVQSATQKCCVPQTTGSLVRKLVKLNASVYYVHSLNIQIGNKKPSHFKVF